MPSSGTSKPSPIAVVGAFATATVVVGGFYYLYRAKHAAEAVTAKPSITNRYPFDAAAKGLVPSSSSVPTNLVKTATISELWVHPVKGMRGMRVPHATVAPTGFVHDREWAVMVDGDKIVSCNKFKAINSATARIETDVVDAKAPRTVLVIDAPNLPTLRVGIDDDAALVKQKEDDDHPPSERTEIDVFGMKGVVQDQGDAAARWLQQLLPLAKTPRLVRVASNRWAKDSPNHQGTNTPADQVKLHDYAAFHIICSRGVSWLQAEVAPVDPTLTLTTEQFRANIVLDDAMPWPQEDHWDTVGFVAGKAKVDSAAPNPSVMRVAKQSGRCVIPTIQNGVRPPSYEPTATLRRLRKCFHRHQIDTATNQPHPNREPCFMFGLDMFPNEECIGAVISVGDTMEVMTVREAPVYLE